MHWYFSAQRVLIRAGEGRIGMHGPDRHKWDTRDGLAVRERASRVGSFFGRREGAVGHRDLGRKRSRSTQKSKGSDGPGRAIPWGQSANQFTRRSASIARPIAGHPAHP